MSSFFSPALGNFKFIPLWPYPWVDIPPRLLHLFDISFDMIFFHIVLIRIKVYLPCGLLDEGKVNKLSWFLKIVLTFIQFILS